MAGLTLAQQFSVKSDGVHPQTPGQLLETLRGLDWKGPGRPSASKPLPWVGTGICLGQFGIS